MKILIVGECLWPQYEMAFARGLKESGVEVLTFSTAHFFKGVFGRIQKKFPFPGPSFQQINRTLIREAIIQKPNFILFWRPTHIRPKSIKLLHKMGINTVSYNNDDPFSFKVNRKVPMHHYFLWYWYIKCLPLFNYNFFYRKINCTEAKVYNVNHSEVLLPYFMPWQDRPIQLNESEKLIYDTDVVFAGHYEPDGREKSIRLLMEEGIRVKIWGGAYWNKAVLGEHFEKLAPIIPAEGENYIKALCGAKICLCFLSKLNRDTYTRRCFEIPACGKVLLAERTKDLLQFFKEDEEACFFSSQEELIRKAKWLINNPEICEKIAKAGLKRVWADGHDVVSRVKHFLSMINFT